MPDLLLNLAPPLILSAAALYASAVCLRNKRRRRQGLPPKYRTPATEARQRLFDEVKAYQQLRADAEQIVTEAYERIAPLYDPPTREHADH